MISVFCTLHNLMYGEPSQIDVFMVYLMTLSSSVHITLNERMVIQY